MKSAVWEHLGFPVNYASKEEWAEDGASFLCHSCKFLSGNMPNMQMCIRQQPSNNLSQRFEAAS